MNFQSIQAYVIDAFTLHAASGIPHLYCSSIRLISTKKTPYHSSSCSAIPASCGRLRISFICSSHVRRPWLWEGRYNPCSICYCCWMPCVRVFHSDHYPFLTDVLGPGCSGDLAREWEKRASMRNDGGKPLAWHLRSPTWTEISA